jgi:hypothetical protein
LEKAGTPATGPAELLAAPEGPLLELAAAIVHRWFADPVNPTLMRGY